MWRSVILGSSFGLDWNQLGSSDAQAPLTFEVAAFKEGAERNLDGVRLQNLIDDAHHSPVGVDRDRFARWHAHRWPWLSLGLEVSISLLECNSDVGQGYTNGVDGGFHCRSFGLNVGGAGGGRCSDRCRLSDWCNRIETE